uniref:Uncharacterized protein n=1 Tax=Anguilla anguilla TaxID=7936 RepID=A0A0E9XWI8_ANGAN
MLKTCSFLNASLTKMVNFVKFCVCDFIVCCMLFSK